MPDFSKIWATNSPLPEFNFTDEEYLEGWNFVDAAPPTKNQFDAWFRQTDEKLKWLYAQLQTTASKLYPVGSVYISFNSTDPSVLFGGVWARLKDTFLLANGDAYAADTTGGSATKTIAVSNMPAHNHTVSSSGAHTHTSSNITVSSNGNHTHERGTMNITGSIAASASDQDLLTYAEQITEVGALSVSTSRKKRGYVPTSDTQTGFDSISLNAKNGWTGATTTNGAHTHTVNISSSGAHTHTTNNTGSGTPINIMPPYTTVYMWRRTS